MDIDITAGQRRAGGHGQHGQHHRRQRLHLRRGDFTFTDVKATRWSRSPSPTSRLAGGTLELSGVTVNNGDTITAAQIANLVYTPVGDANGAPLATFDFTVNDAGLGVVAAQMDIDITPVNDVPVRHGQHGQHQRGQPVHLRPRQTSPSPTWKATRLVSVTITNQSLAGGTLELSGVTVNNGDTITARRSPIWSIPRRPVPPAHRWRPSTSRSTMPDLGVVAAQMDIDITPVNDVPVATPNTVTANEDNPYTFGVG